MLPTVHFFVEWFEMGQEYVNEAGNHYRMFITNARLHLICGTNDLDCFIRGQQKNYLAHIVRMDCERSIKQLTFNNDIYKKRGGPIKILLDQVNRNIKIFFDLIKTNQDSS